MPLPANRFFVRRFISMVAHRVPNAPSRSRLRLSWLGSEPLRSEPRRSKPASGYFAKRSFAQRRRGSALVELALAAPLLLLLLAGVLDYGRALCKATAVSNAARIGAQYGSSSPSKAGDAAGIQAAAINSAPSFSGLTVTSLQSCQCPGGSSVSCAGSCGAAKMMTYVQVTVTANSSAIFSYAGLPFTGNVAGQATMRAQ